jgi:UDP-N-acetylglucosamine 1-carboxyvinyltransferase
MIQPQYTYVINGGNEIRGEIDCLGAKNFATKAMIAAILGDTPSTLYNVPLIGDTQITVELLESIGATLHRDDLGKTMFIDSSTVSSSDVPMADSGTNRMPILLLSALLHRFNRVSVPVLGGCNIGERKVDFHIEAIRQFGGKVEETSEGFIATKERSLRGTVISLPYPSVGATETCLYLSVLAEGRSVIRNAAIEPEIMELIMMLRAMGAIIFTSSNRDIRIEGVARLKGTNIVILGDRIEAASWACLACASNGDIIVHNIRPDTLGNFLAYFQQVGGGFDIVGPNSVRFFRAQNLKHAVIETDVYPGFSTDWQQPFAVLLTQANGISVVHETVYENRFGYLESLNGLGAKTQVTTSCLGGLPCRYRDTNHKHSAIILGPTPLTACSIEIPDLRAGLAYVIAAAIAEGTSTIKGVEFLERGYGNIVPRLTALNLDIERVKNRLIEGA